ncbi:MAG: universal stress protein [Desulfobacteraceae bacterium]|nr:universal stress protein [Desulfobacteraceae bacterium]
MEIKKLLFVTKFEELWFDALQSLLNLRNASLNHVVFLNVIEREKVAMRRGSGYQKSEEIRLREKANIRFIDWAETLFEQGMEVGVYIVVGSLVRKVIEAVGKEDVDLIVIGRPKQGKLEQFFSGSDVTEIVRRSAKPVLIYKHLSQDSKFSGEPFERPLLATDWMPASTKAVAYLKKLKGVVKEVHVIHVVQEKSLKGTSAMAVQKTRKECRRKLEEVCEELEAAGINARAHVYIGDSATEIEKAARECQATMIITGTSGKDAWKERWIGSIPKSLTEKSMFPSLLIPLNAEDGD